MSGRVRGPGRARTAGGSGFAPWWPAADLVLLAAMVVVGSFLLVPVYGSYAPVVATAIGAALSVAMLLLVDQFDLPGWVGVLGIAVLAMPIGSLLVAPDLREFGVVPSIDGFRIVLGGALGGWRDLLTVAVPTGVTGALLVPPLLIGIVGTALAGSVALSGRRPLAVIFPGLALVLFALFGAAAVDQLVVVVITAFFLVAGMGWVLWIGARASRRANARQSLPSATGPADLTAGATAPTRTAGSITRQALAVRRITTAVAVLLVAAVVGTLTATAVTPSRTALRETIEVPVDPAVFGSPLSLFRTFTKQQSDTVEMTALGLPADGRLRLAALDSYDGRQFTASNNEGPFLRIGRERPAESGGSQASVTVTIQGYAGSFLPLPGPILALDFAGDRAAELAADLRYSETADTGLLPGGWRPGDQYTVLAALPPQPTVDQLGGAAPMTLPPANTAALPDILRSKANGYTVDVKTPAAKVEAIRAGLADDGYFSSGGGELQSPAGHGLDRITAMLTGATIVGDQEQYAALMALMVRSIGLSARVAVGFLPPAGSTPDTQVQLRGRNISAWVEVPFEGYGWVAFDPTPDRDKRPDDAQQQSQTERRAVSVDVPPALPPVQPDAADTESANQRPDDSASDPAAAQPESSAWQTALTILGWVALLAGIVALPVLVILALKGARRRRRRRAAEPRDQITGGWAELLDTAVDTGYRPAAWQTRTELAADLRTAGVLQVDWLAPAADAAQFSPGPVNPERARGYWREVDDRSAELLGGLPLWRRWRARLSLASMRRADRRWTSDDIGGRNGPMTLGARAVAGILAAQNVPVYYYRFSYVATSARTTETKGAAHATDIPFFFDTAAIKYGAATTPTDRAAARLASGYLVNFAKTGNPNARRDRTSIPPPLWPAYDDRRRSMLDLDATGGASVGRDPWDTAN
ncbi:MAG: transglutaminaseTgpA domain-containing protein [Nakamurella sp.]